MNTAFATNAERFELRKLALHGALSGLFFAQTLSWQELVDALVVRVVGTTSDDPAVAFWRALAITLFTCTTAYALLKLASCCAPVEERA